MKKYLYILGFLILIAALGAGYFYKTYKSLNIPPKGEVKTSRPGEELKDFSLPPGFSMSVFAKGITGARVMVFDPKGTMLVSETSEGKIVALPNTNSDNVADSIVTVVENLNNPHGMAFRCPSKDSVACELYVAETDAVSVFDYNPDAMRVSNRRKLVDLPGGSMGSHFTRTLLFMPHPNENLLLISVGSSCNVCREKDDRRAKILSYDLATKKVEEFARGTRNSVFMEINPANGAIWATEMGRDGLGDDIPPDEINIIEKGRNYGWPICFGKNIHDTSFDKNTYIRNPCQDPFETPSHIDLQAHSAPLGLAFVPEEGWPEELRFDLLAAYHGSWNRSVPTGYKIVRMKLDEKGNSISAAEDFITGWLRPDGKRIGRPVDIKVLPGGAMYISDDQAGIVYMVVSEK